MTVLLIIYSRFSCDLLNEEAEFFGFISIVSQFFVFKIFDKNFKRSFNEYKSNFNISFFRQKKVNVVQGQENLELRNLKNLIGNGLID